MASTKRLIFSTFKSIDKFGLLTTGVAIMVIGVVLVLFYQYEGGRGEKELMRDGSTLCSLITDLARQELLVEKRNRNYNLLDYVAREKEIMYCLIVDAEQKPLVELGRQILEPDNQLVLKAWASEYLVSQRYRENQSGEVIYEFSKPIYIQGKKAGLVRIGLSLSNYLRFNQRLGYVMGAIALPIFILVFIFYLMLRKMLAPLYKINQDLSRMITEKHEYPRIEVSFNGEIGQLAKKMNEILLVQQKKGLILEEANTSLEVANKILHYEKCRLRAMLNNLKLGLVFIDSTGKAILSNKLASRLLKVEENNYLGKHWEEFLKTQSPQLVRLFSEFHSKDSLYAHEFLEIEAEGAGSKSVTAHSCFYLLDDEDKPLGFLWTITDVTSQKQVESSRYEFVNHVAHELKTPLNTLVSYSEMLIDEEVANEENRREFVNSINEEAIRLSRLINNMLNISKIEMGCLKINRSMIKVDKLLNDCYQTVRAQALNKGIDFMCDLADKMPNLLLDKDLIEVAILNLLTNAIKYTPDCGQVILKGLVDEDQVLIRVSDTGYGIDNGELAHIFDKFFRSTREEIRKQPGSGLGLALALNIVQLHKGDIKVESKLGIGSTFTMMLPREEVYI